MKIKNVKVYGLEESIIRSGYPMQIGEPEEHKLVVDNWDPACNEFNDIKRANNLASVPSGTGHDNFLKGIIVQFDLQYPEYFSPQLQRYHWIDPISSQSKMHKITSRRLTKDDFAGSVRQQQIDYVNEMIINHNKNDEIGLNYRTVVFQNIMANLPSGYLKWMGISTNYLQLKTIYKQRRNHKLKNDWGYFCNWIESLPMSELITGKNGNN